MRRILIHNPSVPNCKSNLASPHLSVTNNIMEQEEIKQRTLQQNKSLHKFFELLATELNDAGYDMKKVVKVDIPWNRETIKEYIWRPVMEAQLLKKSTTEMTTAEVNQVYETINRLMAEKFGIHVPYPSIEDQMLSNIKYPNE